MAQIKLVPYIHTDGKMHEHYFVNVSSRDVDGKHGTIFFLKSHNGKKIRFSTKEREPNINKAKAFANKEFDRRTGKAIRQVRNLIKEELVPYLLLKENEGLAYDTMNNVRRAVKQIEKFWGDKLPNEINRDSFAEWCAWWKVHHPDIEMENAIKYFNNFCTYLHEKVINDRPLLVSKLRFQDPNRHRIKAARELKKERIFTPEEFAIVYSTAANEEEALVVHTMYTMATRIEETLSNDFDRILLDQDVPVYRWYSGNNKAKKVGENALHPSLIEPYRRLRERRRSEGTRLFFPQKLNNQKPTYEQQIDWDGWRKRANLGWHWTSHTFRHTCLTNLFNDPRNPQLIICKLYRISIEVAMKIYVKVLRETMLAMRNSIVVDLSAVSASGQLDRNDLKPLEIGVPKGINTPSNGEQGDE